MTARRTAWIAILAFALVAVFGVLLRPALPIDETRYLSVAWEMRLTGDWLTPHRNGALYSHKPPMLFWLINLVWAVTGVSDFAARLIGPAFATASLGLTWTLGRRLWPETPEAGPRAAAVLAGLSVFAALGGLTMFDAMLTFATLWGLIALDRALAGGRTIDWLSFGAALAFGGLSKGPVILFHLLPALALYPLWAPAAGRPRSGAVVRGGSLALATALGLVALWVAPATLAAGPEYRRAILWTQSVGRMTESFAHARPWWFLIALLPLLLFPFAWSPATWRGLARAPRGDRGMRLCLIWAASALVLFSLTSGKQVHYLLPELPAVALLLGRTLGEERPRLELAVLPVGIAILAALAAAFGVLPLGQADALVEPRLALAGWALAAAGLVWLSLWIGGWRGLVVLGLGLTLSIDLMFGATSAGRAYDAAVIGRELKAVEAGGVAVYRQTYNAEFNFAGRLTRPVAELDRPEELSQWILDHPEGVIVARAEAKRRPDWAPREIRRLGGRLYGLWRVADRQEPAS